MSSGPLIVAAVLAAAVLHASWNAVAKGVQDRFGLMARSSAAVVAVGVVAAWWLPMPAPAAWPWLLASVAVHVVYFVGLLAAYRLGAFNQTYPLARGVGPLVVALVAALVIGESLSLAGTIGVVLIVSAIAVLGLTPWAQVRMHRPAVVAAVFTGLTIAAYTLLDGVGVRRSGSSAGYAVWLLTLHSVGFIAFWWFARGTRLAAGPPQRPVGWPVAAATGLMSMLAYGLVLWAQAHGALAAVAALRESSVVIAAGLGAAILHEPIGRLRIVASATVAAGVLLLAVG